MKADIEGRNAVAGRLLMAASLTTLIRKYSTVW